LGSDEGGGSVYQTYWAGSAPEVAVLLSRAVGANCAKNNEEVGVSIVRGEFVTIRYSLCGAYFDRLSTDTPAPARARDARTDGVSATLVNVASRMLFTRSVARHDN